MHHDESQNQYIEYIHLVRKVRLRQYLHLHVDNSKYASINIWVTIGV